jgi:hypothetical protein
MANYPQQLEAMVNEARLMTCEGWAKRRGWKMKRSGPNMWGPCPTCGGKDRFAIEAVQDKWHCRNCGIGGNDAISLVQYLDNKGLKAATVGELFLEACEVITGRTREQVLSAEEIKQREDALREKQERQDRESERRRQEAREMAHKNWTRSGRVGDIVAGYMDARNIGTDVHRLLNHKDVAKPYSSIRELPDLEYWHDKKPIYKGPAMVLAIQWFDGVFGGVHRTWIDTGPRGRKGKAVIIDRDKGEALESKKVLGSKGDGAVRFYTPADARRIVMGEGFETTLTPYVHAFEEKTAYWGGLDIGHMSGRAARDEKTGKRVPDQPDMQDLKCFKVPEWCEELVLILDGDSDPKKTREALARAAKRQKLLRPGLSVKIVDPGRDVDMNDLVMGKG